MIIALVLLWLFFVTLFVIECLRAPFGFEDSKGFHFSRSPQLPSVVRKPVRRRHARRVAAR